MPKTQKKVLQIHFVKHPELAQELKILQAQNNFKTLEETIKFLINNQNS